MERLFYQIPWGAVLHYMGATGIQIQDSEVRFHLGNRNILIQDNGGEFNVLEIVRAYPKSIAYTGDAPQGPMTVASRIHAALLGRGVNYSHDVDKQSEGAAR